MILYGADYNPEQWKNNPQIIEADIRFMKEAGCNVMSVGIFAWSEFECEEGKYNFSFYDKILDKLYNNGIKVFLATPSAAKPAWMSKKYPEILITGANGIRRKHGMRLNHCYTSPVYREKVHSINEALAKHFGNHPALLGWHVSNEYCGECHCELCKNEFRKWLKEKYNSLNKLNEQWCTAFWSHTYTEWEQIEPPTNIGEDSIHGLRLDWHRFITHQTVDFYKNEIEPLKRITPDKPVTTNFYSMLGRLDYWKMKDYVDIVSWDIYPEWEGEISNADVAAEAAFTYDMCRSIKKQPFLLMESTPSTVNWREIAKLKRPGMNKLSSLQAVASGADSVQYFQWRKSRGGYEKFHGAVIDHSGRNDTRVFTEVKELGEELKRLKDVSGTGVRAEVAVIFDFENLWALNESKGFQNSNKKYTAECMAHHKYFLKNGINTDVINQEQDFLGYKIIAAPMMYMLKDGVAERLKEFVKSGGILVSGFMSGYVNENDLCFLDGFPGDGLRELFGIWNEEIDTLYPNEHNSVIWDGVSYPAIDYCECVHIENAEVLGRYESDFYADMPAVSVNCYGKGKAYYIAFRSNEAFIDKLYSYIIRPDKPVWKDVYVRTREKNGKEYIFIQNFGDKDCCIQLDKKYSSLLDGNNAEKEIVIKAKDTVVLTELGEESK